MTPDQQNNQLWGGNGEMIIIKFVYYVCLHLLSSEGTNFEAKKQNITNLFEAHIRQRALQFLSSRESQLDEKGNVFSMNAEWM